MVVPAVSSGSTPKQRARAVKGAVDRFNATQAPGGGFVRVSFNDDDRADTRGLDRVFTGLEVTLSGMASVLASGPVLDVIRAQFDANFKAEGGRTKWAQLAPSTVQERIRKGYGGRHPILRRTGALRTHVLTAPAKVTTTGRGATLRIAPSPSVKGVRKYAMLAKGGTTPTGGKVPARPMVVLTPGGATKVSSAISRALRTRAAANGIR
jgi:hypothetical protein